MTPVRAASGVATGTPVGPGVLTVWAVSALLVLLLAAAVAALVVQRGRRRRDAAEARALAERLRRDAYHDALTGLLNREGFLHAAAGPLAEGGAVAVVDLVLLGAVNDTLGHARGEVFVRLAAERLGAAGAVVAADGFVAARLEGDTFAVVLPRVDGHDAHRVAETLRERLLAPYLVEGVPFEAPVVVGVAADGPWLADVPAGTERTATLLRRADVALAATRDGREPVRCYEPSMGERAARRLRLIRGFSAAVARRDVRVDFQPVVSLGERTVVGVEALARWDHPELGLLLPDEFVPVLEATGQIGELTSFVLDEALVAARRWLDRGMRLSVAVNVAVVNLGNAAFPDEVADLLAAHRVPAELLTLELTESGVSSEREVALPVLRRLHALGCRLAVDDFGTGQSSLAHLRRLPVDQVKIDKSFVLGMGTEYGDVAVVRAIVEMGHTLGLQVVAEGVEQAAVRVALAEMGCDVAQGYLVSRPLPAVCFDEWLDTLDVLGSEPGAAPGPRTLIA
ncbi:MAG: diguanylate cyclase/phosphodiesterase (GGDEF & EAL domains) with PAS/PAC sensor(s) [uncultured Actinomycetospora sp.]|uniref:Diguanylate cyclase/phosphodiesterase (GGDEF & EAL domains) with PAS/PAC sensor(S) n=1 Tax=uncultured Actinomycetospora sp. TaxID=1135996 RepID=A0A6J4K5Y8_9PSEU|nr:MAG: diguanylate cyclase/phosphodiesterase (GGDEF & EAL domains) with PAS/PAC sensor(s) [uncultured Actinomycetospora sp.]